MNYIAHLHLARHTNTDLLGNFMGDFVKGRQWQTLSAEKQLGIRLHRWVDGFTDTHPQTKSLFRVFPDKVKRFAGIALDVYFDHLLLNHWQSIEHEQVNDLFTRFYQQLNDEDGEWPVSGHYYAVRERLLTHRWLADYANPTTCLQAMLSIERRSRFNLAFAHPCYEVLEQHKPQITSTFLAFYPELMDNAKQQINVLKSR